MKPLIKSDIFYFFRTSKWIVFGALIGIFSIISPLSARYINELISALIPAGQGLTIDFPDPTVFDSYLQYFNDLNEIILWVIVFVGINIFIRDKTKGLMPLIMSKPINRTRYLLSKYITFSALLFGCLVIGYLIFTYYTYVLFDDVFFLEGLITLLYYFVFIEFLLGLALLMSVLFKSYIVAMIFTFIGYILISLLTLFADYGIFRYLPGTLNNYGIQYILKEGVPDGAILALIVTMAIIVILLFLCTHLFKKQSLV